jgi:thiamine transport system permease protein
MDQTLVSRNPKKIVAFFIGLSFWVFFFFLPFFGLLEEFFFSSFQGSYRIFLKTISDSWYQSIFLFTFQQAFLSAFFTILIGVPTSFLFVKFEFPFFQKIYFLLLLPFIMPTILVVLSIIQFWGHQGLLNSILKFIFSMQESPLKIIYSLKGILIAHIFFNLPVVLQIVGVAKQTISSKYQESALVLGCNEWRFFWKVDLPLLLPAISSAFILIFLLCINSFAIVWVLGGGKNLILESLIYELAKIHLDYQTVSIFVLFQILLGVVFVKFFYHFQINPITQEPIKKVPFFYFWKKNPFSGLAICIWLFFIFLFVLGPLFALVLDSFRNAQGFTSHWWYLLFSNWKIFIIFLQSFGLAISSSSLSFFLLLLIFPFFLKFPKYRKNLEMLFLIPLSSSFIALGLGWFLFYQKFLSGIHFPLFLYIICIHTVIFFAYWMKIFVPALESVPQSWIMIKNLYGYSWFYFSKNVLFPWLKKPFLQNFSLIMALSFGELNLLLMIADNKIETITTSIFSAISNYQFSYGSAIGVFFLLYFFLQNFLVELCIREKHK